MDYGFLRMDYGFLKMDYGLVKWIRDLAKNKFEVLRTQNFDRPLYLKFIFMRDPLSILRVCNPCSGIRSQFSGIRNLFSYNGLRIPYNGLRIFTSP